jgi:hypothetical protein
MVSAQIEYIRTHQQEILATAKQTKPPLRMESMAVLSALGAEMWDNLSAIREGCQWKNPYSYGSDRIYGPYLPTAQGILQIGMSNHLTMFSPDSEVAKKLASFYWKVDSPMLDISLLHVRPEDLPVPIEGALGQYARENERNKIALRIARLYRWQATLFDLAVVWDTVLRTAEVGRKHGATITKEVDAVSPMVDDLMKMRHPATQFCADSLRNMIAHTPDGSARAFTVTEATLKKLMASTTGNGWFELIRPLSTLMEEGAAAAPPQRVAIFDWLNRIRPLMEVEGAAMLKMAQTLWPSGPATEQLAMYFNQPPFSITDGISSGASASEVIFGMRTLIPVTSTGLRYDIDRDVFNWNEYSVTPVEREEAPGQYIHPDDGMPTDIIPAALYMGEPGAERQPSSSIVRRLEQLGMLDNYKRLVSEFGVWPNTPGTYGYSEPKEGSNVKAVKEAIGPFIVGNEASLSKAVDLPTSKSLKASMAHSEYYVRPDGFANRRILKRMHPRSYYYVNIDVIDRYEMKPLWYADWPVSPQDMSMSRPLVTAITAKVMSCFPGLKA